MAHVDRRPKAFSVSFKDMERWSVAFFRQVQWEWSNDVMNTLGSCLLKVSVPVDCCPESAPIIEKISFGGELSLLPEEKRKGYKGRLFRAESGQLIYSKIRVKQGSICVIPGSSDWIAVSSEYPVYSLDKSRIDSVFLELVLRSSAFKHYLDGLSHGGSTKTRISPNEFERLRIPIPPLAIQKTIVEIWQESNQAVSLLKYRQNSIVEKLNSILQQMTNGYFELKNSRFIIADFSKSSQWDVKSGRSAVFRSLNPDFVRLGDFSKECSEKINPWDDPEKDWPVYGVNNDEGVFFNCYQKGAEFNAAYKKIQKNWFFHNPTRANVGSLGIVPDVPDDAITSPEYQVWKLNGGYLPEFMALALKTDYFLTLVEFNRVGGVKQRMYYANLAEIRLPLLDMNIQMQFADEWKNILLELRKAEQKQIKSHVEIEEMIIGIRPVERI